MSRMHWKFARVGGVITVSIILYLLLRVKNYSYKANVFLPNAHPDDVWEFVADFSNMKILNPTIENFMITDENGNYKHWKYTVEYKEYLSHWPNLPNYAVAKFSIKVDSQTDNKFSINSIHTTCFINNFFCLDSQSEFIFTHGNSSKGTFCEEKVNYQCPVLFFTFCEREVEYQRKAIMYNLKYHFS